MVVAVEDDGRKGTLFFDQGNEQSFLWAELTQAEQWEVDTSPKPTLSADDLKQMILRQIQLHPGCPAGMSVEIRSTSGSDWEAYSVPPPGQHIAYAACADYISKVARAFRALYGVQLTPVEASSGVPVGWMNGSDAAANQIVQTAAANRRRNMADMSSGTTSIVPPQEQPLQTVGLSAVQGRGTLTVTFADNEAVTGWLNGQSEDVAVVFAARAALRVIPTITFSPWPGTGRRTTNEVVLRVFRAVAAAWSVAAYPGQRKALNNAARAALSGLGDLKAPSPIRAAVYASAIATGEAGAPSRASTAVGYALDAVGSKGQEASELFLQALATDASLLHERFSAVTLANSKLWPDRIPGSVSDDWGKLRATLLGQNQDWEVWTEWYDARLAGDVANHEFQVARATMDDAIWQQSPTMVNAHVKQLITEAFRHATEDKPDELPEADAIPLQATAASQFALNAEGRLDLLADAPLRDDMQRDIYQEVRHKALALSGLGHNQLADMSEPVQRFLIAAPERIEDVSIIRFWSRGNTLRRRLKAHDAGVASDADPTDPAILSASVADISRAPNP